MLISSQRASSPTLEPPLLRRLWVWTCQAKHIYTSLKCVLEMSDMEHQFKASAWLCHSYPIPKLSGEYEQVKQADAQTGKSFTSFPSTPQRKNSKPLHTTQGQTLVRNQTKNLRKWRKLVKTVCFISRIKYYNRTFTYIYKKMQQLCI